MWRIGVKGLIKSDQIAGDHLNPGSRIHGDAL